MPSLESKMYVKVSCLEHSEPQQGCSCTLQALSYIFAQDGAGRLAPEDPYLGNYLITTQGILLGNQESKIQFCNAAYRYPNPLVFSPLGALHKIIVFFLNFTDILLLHKQGSLHWIHIVSEYLMLFFLSKDGIERPRYGLKSLVPHKTYSQFNFFLCSTLQTSEDV